MTEELHVEAEGADAEEASARALAEIRRKAPWIESESVSVQVVEEGERGLLGIGSRPARAVAFALVPDQPAREESELAASLRAYAEAIARTIAPDTKVELSEEAETVSIRFSGGDLGVLIGRRGQTVDAIEQIANAIVHQQVGPGSKRASVDAGGYRERQKAALSYAALQAAKRVISSGEPQALEPMSAYERRLVHERLKGYAGVTTTSEGSDPSRHVVVLPADAD
ncbi:MAG TPA: RNA-binding cell elongation regulator Jag/EloR [Gaiellaceae bacterium]